MDNRHSRIKVYMFSDEVDADGFHELHWEWVGESDICAMNLSFFKKEWGYVRRMEPRIGLAFQIGPFDLEIVEFVENGPLIIAKRVNGSQSQS